jgi:hypothetical protein
MIALTLAGVVSSPTARAATPRQSPTQTPRQPSAVIQGGTCNAFTGAKQLPGSGAIKPAAYTDSSVVVPACGPLPGNQSGKPYVQAYPGGLNIPGYQCVEFSERYLYYRFGVTMSIPTNGDEVVAHYVAKYPSEFTSVANGTAGQAPMQGDVLSISTSSKFTSASGGHTGVVESSSVNGSGTGTVTIIEENASAAPSGVQTLKITAWKVAVKGYAYVKWLRPTWHIVTSPNTSGGDDQLHAVSCFSTSFCMATGYDADGAGQTLAEEWKGKSWIVLTSPNAVDTTNNALEGVSCPSANFCMAVGAFETSSGNDQTLIEEWNGSNWGIAGSPDTSSADYDVLLGVSCTSVIFCMAVGAASSNSTGGYGQTLVEEWNGSTWTIVGSPSTSATDSNVLNGVSCVSASFCMAAGSVDDEFETLIEAWNGTAWSIVSSPNTGTADVNSLSSVSCASVTFCMAAGPQNFGNTPSDQTLMEEWNGTIWSIVASPNPPSTIDWRYGVNCPASNFCVAGGYNVNLAGQYDQTLTEMWNGGGWSIVSSANATSTDDELLFAVSCTSATFCMTVGTHGPNGSLPTSLIEEW